MITDILNNSLYEEAFFQSNAAIFILKITNLVKFCKNPQIVVDLKTDKCLLNDMVIKNNLDSLVTMHSMNDAARKLIGYHVDSINIENKYYENKIIKNIIDHLLALLIYNKEKLKSCVVNCDYIKNYAMHCDIIKCKNDSFAVSIICDVEKSSVTSANIMDDGLVGYVEKYYLLLKSINNAIILVKVDTGTIVEYNNSASVLFKVENLSDGYTHAQFYKGEDRDRYLEYYNNVLIGVRHEDLEINLSRNNNSIPVRINISFLHIGGEKIAQVILIDMSNELILEKRRKLLATAIDQVGESVVITNFSGDIEYVNSAYEEISGYSLKEVIGKRPNIFQDDKSSSYHHALMWKELSQGKVWRGNFTNKKKSGESYCEDVTISPVKGKNGEIVNFVAVNRDITQQLIIESQIRQSQKMQAIGMLAGGIAHDFNNILTAILGYAELCQMHCEKNTIMYSNIEEIVKASIRAGELIDQIREFSRHKNKEVSSFQIGKIVKEVYKLIRASISPRIEIVLEISNDAHIKGDQTQIHQVLMNLWTNAYQSIEKNNGKIIVRLFTQYFQPAAAVSIGRLQGGEYVCIQIEDSGKGIPEEYMERIFEPYFTTRKLQGGTGLGLSVVHGIVNEHRGAIIVKSVLGSGSCFNVYLPVAETENDENKHTPDQQKKPHQSAS